MKFGKNSPLLFSRIPCDLSPLPYKSLKKRMKVMSPGDFFTHFGGVIRKMNADWLRAVNDMRMFFLYAFWRRPEKTCNLLAYAQLCREGVRKLVKKFNKKHPLQQWSLDQPLHFISSVVLRRLSEFAIVHPSYSITECLECPVCLQVPDCTMVMVCGHSLCLICYERLRCSQLFDKISDFRTPAPKCPICRQPMLASGRRGHENSKTKRPFLT